MKEKIRSKILDGCLQEKEKSLIGVYHGFYIRLEEGYGQYVVEVSANSEKEQGNAAVEEFLRQQQRTKERITGIEVKEKRIRMSVRAKAKEKNLPEILNDHIKPLIDFLSSSGYVSDDIFLNEGQQEPQKKEEIPKSNFIAGTAGAVLGAIPGVILWVLIGRLGYISGLAGVVIAVCVMWGYLKLGHSLDKKGVACTVIIMIFSIYFSNRLTWTWEVYDVLKSYDYKYTFFDVYRSLKEIIESSDALMDYYRDLVVGYLLMVFCVVRTKF